MGTLYEASQEIKSWITDQPVQEESLTDWMLRYISKYKKNFHYYLFNKTQEACNGADWLWCIKTNPYIYLFLVQAKKTKKTPSENYSGLNQHNGDQIVNLLNEAKTKNLYPIYTFYTNENYQTKCGAPKIDEGAFLASAYDIKKLFDAYGSKIKINSRLVNATHTESLLNNCIGLSCLEDCPLCNSEDSHDFENFLTNYLVNKIEDFNTKLIDENSIYRYKQDEVPSYISALPPMKPNGQGVSLPDWYQKEFSSQIQNLNGIVVFDFTKKTFDY
ncbi:DUF6615 family protein [Lachnoclostridium phytofermentans]|uniref:Uncharacterized protein n=1 Tax=Lachnoclostridium phytofermentans (strain ATCC 700394 / DSM 18823 / ISDg) TaxID=357809 RepID=A9KJC3_LACP7|nr:DUF6615 family protein [Lachnoclostridium phytofermentans]ABX42535.1 hypothetical protein Cphy_2169 [Lachnoclostridium phytofermentans ISDg]